MIGRTLASLALVLVVVTQGAGLRNWFFDTGFAKSAWRDAIAEFYFHRQPDEVALLVSGHAYPVFDTYLPPDLGIERYRLPAIDILDVHQVLGGRKWRRALNSDLQGKGGVWLFLWQDEVVDPTHVVTTMLDRYAQGSARTYVSLHRTTPLPAAHGPEWSTVPGPAARIWAAG